MGTSGLLREFSPRLAVVRSLSGICSELVANSCPFLFVKDFARSRSPTKNSVLESHRFRICLFFPDLATESLESW